MLIGYFSSQSQSAAHSVHSLTRSLGATVQAMYYCPRDQKETEKHPLHTCGTETIQIRGWKWLNNDWVNFPCSASGVIVVQLIIHFFSYGLQ